MNNLSALDEIVIPGFDSYFISSDDADDDDDCDLDGTNSKLSAGDHPDDDNIHSNFDKQEELLRLLCFIHISHPLSRAY